MTRLPEIEVKRVIAGRPHEGDFDLVVVGGGPAGACAASLLAGAGRATLLIEREAEPRHKICGEFLSIEAQACLRTLGVDVRALGGVPIAQLRLVSGRSVAEARLPFEGMGLTRRTLDEALLRCARQHGAVVRRGLAVRAIEPVGGRIRLKLGGGGTLETPTLFLATGKHDVRGAKRAAGAGSYDLIGFKAYFRLAPLQFRALEEAIEVVLFEGGYAGLQLVEGGAANLCLLAERTLFERAGGSWEGLLSHLRDGAPHLGSRLEGAEALLDRPLSISRVPYGFVHRDQGSEPDGLFRLGDQAGVIPSFAGDGIAIALHTARVAAATYLARGNAASEFHRQVSEDIAGQIRLASILYGFSTLALGRAALVMLGQAFPGTMRSIASRTRVPSGALQRAEAMMAGGAVDPTTSRTRADCRAVAHAPDRQRDARSD